MHTLTQIQALFDSQRLPRKTQSLEWYLEQVNAGQSLYLLDSGTAGEDDTIAASSEDEAREIVGDYALERGWTEVYGTGYGRLVDSPELRTVYETPFEATGWSLSPIEM